MRNLFRLLQRLRSKSRDTEKQKEIPLEPSETLPIDGSPQLSDLENSEALPGEESWAVDPSAEESSEAMPEFNSLDEFSTMEPPAAPPEPTPEVHSAGVQSKHEPVEQANSLLGQLGRLFPHFSQLKGYESNREHLMDELWRIDHYLHAQIVRWKETIAEHKPARQWGMLRVTAEEIEAYLESDFKPAGELSSSMESRMQEYWQKASAKEKEILRRRLKTQALGRSPLVERANCEHSARVFSRDVAFQFLNCLRLT